MFYLVTGGCGFIGSHLCDALIASGHRVRVLDDLSSGKREHLAEGAELIQGDITEAKTVQAAMEGVDGCFHLAAIASVARSESDWVRCHQVNLTGSIHVFDAARILGMPVVYASSAAVYGDVPVPPLYEAMKPEPISAYGADKLGCELHATIAWKVHHVHNVGLRFFNVYGPRQDPASIYAGVISIFLQKMQAGEPITIFGDGEQSRDFIYVADIVQGLELAMQKLEHKHITHAVCNLCTGKAISVNVLAQKLMACTGSHSEVKHASLRAGDVKLSLGDPSCAEALLGFTAKVAFDNGLQKTVEYFA